MTWSGSDRHRAGGLAWVAVFTASCCMSSDISVLFTTGLRSVDIVFLSERQSGVSLAAQPVPLPDAGLVQCLATTPGLRANWCSSKSGRHKMHATAAATAAATSAPPGRHPAWRTLLGSILKTVGRFLQRSAGRHTPGVKKQRALSNSGRRQRGAVRRRVAAARRVRHLHVDGLAKGRRNGSLLDSLCTPGKEQQQGRG